MKADIFLWEVLTFVFVHNVELIILGAVRASHCLFPVSFMSRLNVTEFSVTVQEALTYLSTHVTISIYLSTTTTSLFNHKMKKWPKVFLQ